MKKYYWLKLKKDFFKRHDIKIIESMPNGKDYILFYLKMLVESLSHNGNLRFSDIIPYNEEMLSVITNTNVDIVRSAMRVFVELKMIQILDDQTIFMNEVKTMIGSETEWAEKKRKYLQKKIEENTEIGKSPHDVLNESDKSKSIEKEKEKEIIIYNLENVNNPDITSKKISRPKKEKVFTSEILLLNEAARKYFEEKYINYKSAECFDALVKKGYSINDIKRAILNARADDFWSAQFISPQKLRSKDKNDVLYIDRFLKLKANGNDRHDIRRPEGIGEFKPVV